MRFPDKIRTTILNHKECRAALMQYFSIMDSRTIKTWIENDDERLFNDECLELIEWNTGIPKEMLIQN